MNPVKGTAIYTAEKFTDIRDLVIKTCERFPELDAFIFNGAPCLELTLWG